MNQHYTNVSDDGSRLESLDESTSNSTDEQSTTPPTSVLGAPDDRCSVATDENNRKNFPNNDELNHPIEKISSLELSPAFQPSSQIHRSFLGDKSLNAFESAPNSKDLNYKSPKNVESFLEEKREGEESTSPYTLPSFTTEFESNGDIGTLTTPAHDDELSRELESELVRKRENTPVGDAFDAGISAAARAAIRGQGVPNIRQNLNVKFATSERTDVTDLGNRMHDLKSQGLSLSELLSSRGDPREPIQDRLIDILQETPGYPEKKGFFPRDLLASIIDEECVLEELVTHFKNVLDESTIRKYAQEICGISPTGEANVKRPLFKKIFVTLVLSEKTSTILKFLTERVTDDDLPLAKVSRPGKPPGNFGLGRRGQPLVPLKCFQGWSVCTIRWFEEWQWTTIAPFFARSNGRKKVNHFPLHDQVILPFISDSRRDADNYEIMEFEGGFSQVFKVDIHPQHHDFQDPFATKRSFAIKCLLSRDRKDFNREVEMLKKFSGDSHPHLVSLLATYEQFKRFYLVFHWAEADLLDYWKDRNPRPSVDLKTILWMARQCKGIADGLSKIHHYESSSSKAHQKSASRTLSQSGIDLNHLAPPNSSAPGSSMEQLYGRHGDIKPANVLLFRSQDDDDNLGTLKLTDFGLAEFKAHSRSYKPKSKIAASPGYRPPECDLQDGGIGRSYDIWTLGCLYLEFITWLLGGWDLVQTFTKKRTSVDIGWFDDMLTDTFFEIVKCKETQTPGAMIKPAVKEFISDLHRHESCTEYIHEFLDLIQGEMLIVKTKNPNIRDRLSCEEVDRKLTRMLRLCEEDADYASKPAPWKRSRRESCPDLERAIEVDLPKPVVEALLKKDLRVHSGPMQKKYVEPSPKRLCYPMEMV